MIHLAFIRFAPPCVRYPHHLEGDGAVASTTIDTEGTGAMETTGGEGGIDGSPGIPMVTTVGGAWGVGMRLELLAVIIMSVIRKL